MSLYTENTYSAATTYNLWDIIKYGNYYYYSLANGNVGNTPSSVSTFWNGVGVFNGITKPRFFFKSSYGAAVSVEPRIKSIQMGDGYQQRIPDHINHKLIKLDLVFDLRSTMEAQSINHFLEKRGSSESFIFTPSPPYDEAKLFYCRSWKDTYVFLDNHTIACSFDECVN